MVLDEVLGVLDALTSASCMVWVAGGWGVDAFVGRQTRAHRDLDLAVDARHAAIAIQILEARGYSVDTDWRPARVELAGEGRGWVDLHPVDKPSSAQVHVGFGHRVRAEVIAPRR
jgi:lincosamide nucleotidyltransferase A/C/D/E